MNTRRFVLCDRDGTINIDRDYLSDPDQLELLPEAARGLRYMQAMGLGLVVVTNQSAIGRGYFDVPRLTEIHKRLSDLLAVEAVTLDGIYYCPHTPDDNCTCRKPRTELAEMAARNLNFEPQQSFVIGDKACDIDLGRNLNATTILVRTGYGAEAEHDASLRPDYVVDNLYQAALLIETKLAIGAR